MEEIKAEETEPRNEPANESTDTPIESPSKKERHCLCDSRDYSTFMICCDQCGIWYHGDCVQVTRSVSKRIEKYFCSICISKDGSLEIVYKSQKKERTPRIEDKKEPAEKKEKKTSNALPGSVTGSNTEKCGNCIGCLWNSDCGKCMNCTENKQPCLKRICVQAGQLQKKKKILKAVKKEDDDSKHLPKSPVHHTVGRPGRKPSKPVQNQSDAVDKRSKKEASIATNLEKVYNGYYRAKKHKQIVKEEDERQCYGPGCVNSARSGSNYCSDTCGMALAEKRLRYILPDRIAAFYRQKPVSETQDMEKIRDLLETKNVLEAELKKLDECADNVENWISTLSNAQPASDKESSTLDDGTFMVSCAVCTTEHSMRNIAKHMQKCFVKTEKQSTFGTPLALPQNPKKLVCDVFNKIDKTYCKRLRVMCSEHWKDETEDIKVCGAPLAWFEGNTVDFKNLFADPELLNKSSFCMEKRKHCHIHNNWAQNALGLIDNERMNILLQLDENQEKHRQLISKRATRGDVISLLCNHTISENPATSPVPNNTNISQPVST
ncbi:PHD-finger domain-containing protein [Ditylenchus destructor]|nr:PHD-finger domain-containing protein [Ditylenchus destructor]